MAKIKLGNRPKTFKRIVTFPMLDGTTGSIEMVYRYRTRKEFGEFIDELRKENVPTKRDGDEEPFDSLVQQFEKSRDHDASYVLNIAEGWNLEEEFSRENIQQMIDEFPGALTAIVGTYRLAIVDGIVKN